MSEALPVRDRQQRPQWQLALAYIGTFLLYVLAGSLDWRAAAGGLVWAAVIRGVYVWFRRRRGDERRFTSPWFFALAALCAALSLAGQRAREQDATDERAAARGVVAAGAEVTPTDRCVTKVLDESDEMPATLRAKMPAGLSIEDYGRQICTQAVEAGALDSSGNVRPTDGFMQSACVSATMIVFDALKDAERRFSRADFEKVTDRTCTEAARQDLIEGARRGANQSKLEAVQAQVVTELLRSGEIHERP